MMRYRLRTLLIVIGLSAVVLARVGYLKRVADAHRRTIEALIPDVGAAERLNEAEVRDVLAKAATGDKMVATSGFNGIVFDTKRGAVFSNNRGIASIWDEAVAHQAIAKRFDDAVYRPWTFVTEERRPSHAPPIFQLDFYNVGFSILTVGLCLTWFIIRRANQCATSSARC